MTSHPIFSQLLTEAANKDFVGKLNNAAVKQNQIFTALNISLVSEQKKVMSMISSATTGLISNGKWGIVQQNTSRTRKRPTFGFELNGNKLMIVSIFQVFAQYKGSIDEIIKVAGLDTFSFLIGEPFIKTVDVVWDIKLSADIPIHL